MEETEQAPSSSETNSVELPAPTGWPMILAFGVMLSFASLVTNTGIGIVGVALAICGCVGWFRQVLPEEHHEMVARVAAVTEAVSV